MPALSFTPHPDLRFEILICEAQDSRVFCAPMGIYVESVRFAVYHDRKHPSLARWMDANSVESLTIITASDPGGIRATDEENDRRMKQLHYDLLRADLEWFDAWSTPGCDGRPSERHFAVMDMDHKQAHIIAARYTQVCLMRISSSDGLAVLEATDPSKERS